MLAGSGTLARCWPHVHSPPAGPGGQPQVHTGRCLRRVCGPSRRPVGVPGGPRFGEVTAPARRHGPAGRVPSRTRDSRLQACCCPLTGSEGRPRVHTRPGAAAGGTQPWRLAVARVAPGPPGSLPQAPSRRRLLVSGALSLSSHSGWQSCSCRSSLSEDLPTTRLRRRFRPSLQGSIPEDLLLKQLGLLLA